MLDESEPSPYAASYDDPKIRETYENADLIRESIGDGSLSSSMYWVAFGSALMHSTNATA
ncbi:hypothetical protein C6A85_12135 [Mycobacterium sp. ITM-2017-0098]|nr:hypothetical protein C6A85_12135 [Mycobacterium sp. ITM-2017-0098]